MQAVRADRISRHGNSFDPVDQLVTRNLNDGGAQQSDTRVLWVRNPTGGCGLTTLHQKTGLTGP